MNLGQLVSSVEYLSVMQPCSSKIRGMPLATTEAAGFPMRVCQRPGAKGEI